MNPPTAPVIHTIVSVPFMENTYVVHLPDRPECVVIDPGLEPQKIFSLLEREQLLPVAILLTHGHADHIGGNAALKQRWPELPMSIGAADAPMLTDSRLNLSAWGGAPFVSPPADHLLKEGDRLDLAGLQWDVLDLPGHSPGHVVYLLQQFDPILVLGGDVLFEGSIGRCDFPGGNQKQLVSGIRKKLFVLPETTRVYPGHGDPTTTGVEQRTNPFCGIGS